MHDIGLIGVSRSGKDTAGAHLVSTHGYARVAFADPVRASMLALDPWLPVRNETYGDGRETDGEVVRLSLEVERLGWERAKDAYPEVRRLLQAYASEAVRDVVGADAWLRLGLDALRVNRDEDMRTVFTDVRFPNEVDALRAHGVRMVYVHRPSASAANGHISERSVTMHDADVVIANDGTIADLQRRIARVAGA